MDSRAMQSAARQIVYPALVAGCYFVLTVAFAPISYGPFQLRIAGLLMPLCLTSRWMSVGLALGTAFANVFSPFGWYDWFVMPICVLIITQWAYATRRSSPIALLVLSTSMAMCIMYFPLHMGGELIMSWQLYLGLWSSLVILYIPGWLIVVKAYRQVVEGNAHHYP